VSALKATVSALSGRWARLWGLALSCLALGSAPAPGQDSAFDAGNLAAAQGKWAEAARAYENVIARHGYSAPVLFNLANAQVAEGKLGPAILNYERARWLAPHDPDSAANLALARQKAGLAPETLSPLAAVAHSMTWSQWSILATAMLWLVLTALPLRRILPRARPALTAGAILGALVFLAAAGALALRWPDLDRAIVTAPEAAARVSPVTIIRPLFTLKAGEPVAIRRTHGAFLLIANRQGREGWVSRGAVTPLGVRLPQQPGL
jgi:tetratricopeptide (TPR) repeat protein